MLKGILSMLLSPKITEVRMDVETLEELRSLVARRIDKIDEKKCGRPGIKANLAGEHGYRNTYLLINDLIEENS